MDRLKRLLALSWSMPPIVLPRSIQIARSLKTLSQRGWTCDVVCPPLDTIDDATLDDRFAGLYAPHYRQHHVEHREALRPSSLPRRMIRKWRPPRDIDQDNWTRRAGTFLLRFCRRTEVDVLVTFAQPWVDHQVGLHVKRRRRDLPWLAHFSDPWVDSLYLRPDAAEMETWRRQERAVIESADAVVFVTAQTADLVMAKYPSAWRRKVHVVPHGFDRDLLPQAPALVNSGGPLLLVYTGNIYAGRRDPECLFEALALLGGGARLEGRLGVAFYGNAPVETVALRDRMDLDRIVTFHGNVGYLDSLRLAGGADLLLLIDAKTDVNVFLPSKIVDYLMLRRPILGLTPAKGASAAVLKRTGNFVAPPDDAPAVAELLARLLERHEASEPLNSGHSTACDRFDIRETTRAFEAALTAAIDHARRP